jgi:hypothetical protein
MPKSLPKGKKITTQKKRTLLRGGVGSKKFNTHTPTTSSTSIPKSNQCALCHKSLSTLVGQNDSEDEIAEIGLNCGHKFHYNCIKPFMKSMKGICPICKENI